MRSFNQAFTNIRRTPYQALVAILALTITFLIGIIISFVSVSFYQALNYFETRPQVLIFFKPEATQEQIDQVKTNLAGNPSVSQTIFVPQEEALNIYKNLHQNDPLLLELVTADILPASLEISTKDLISLKEVAASVQTAPGVDEVALRSDIVDILNKWLYGIRLGGLIFVGLMATTSILIIIIVVGMKISGKSHEIKILELIGASSWYIQSPFLAEGALYGFFSALIAYTVAFTLLLYSTPIILRFAGEVPLLPTSPLVLVSIFTSSIGIGTLIGTFGSWLSLKRYLRL